VDLEPKPFCGCPKMMTEGQITRNQRSVIRQSPSEARCSQVHPLGPCKCGLPHQQKALQLLEENSTACQISPVTKGGFPMQGGNKSLFPASPSAGRNQQSDSTTAAQGNGRIFFIWLGFLFVPPPLQSTNTASRRGAPQPPCPDPATPPAYQQAAPVETDGPFRSQLLQTHSVQPKPRRQK